jgi:hypothetical protein
MYVCTEINLDIVRDTLVVISSAVQHTVVMMVYTLAGFAYKRYSISRTGPMVQCKDRDTTSLVENTSLVAACTLKFWRIQKNWC